MQLRNNRQIELDSDDSDLLIWNIPNEVMNGFKVDNFHERIGVSKEEFKSIANRLRSVWKTEKVVLDSHEVRAFHNALAITLDELGLDEFQTRTGHDFDKGNLILQELNNFIEQNN